MLFAECPLCDAPAIVDDAEGTLVCEPCALSLAIDDRPQGVELPLAA